MKNLLCFLVMTLSGMAVSAQKVHFVYFETDNAQPFYLKMDDKVFSSSSAGSFILPNLPDSTYNLSIGFPATSNEAKFKLEVTGKDYGYAIKTFDFGLGLFDLQSLSVMKPQADNWKSNVSYQYRNNDFTSLLAKASNDTSLFYVPIIKNEVVVQKQEPKVEIKKDGPAEKISDTGQVRFDSAVVIRPEATGISGVAAIPVVKPSEKQGNPFVFPGALTTDSVSNKEAAVKTMDSAVVMPAVIENPSVVARDSLPLNALKAADSTAIVVVGDTVVTAKQMITDTTALQNEMKTEYRRSTVRRYSESSTSEGFGLIFFDIYEGATDTIKIVIPNPRISFKEADTTQFENGLLEIKKDTQSVIPTSDAKKVVPKSNCTATANDADFFKLRKNMAAKETDDDMINEAKKVFRSKCFSTGQIKNLSSLFLSDEGKYRFFDAAYMHVTDQQVFYALKEELKEEYYLKRFKALIGE